MQTMRNWKMAQHRHVMMWKLGIGYTDQKQRDECRNKDGQLVRVGAAK
jgi:hypothetical protein